MGEFEASSEKKRRESTFESHGRRAGEAALAQDERGRVGEVWRTCLL